MKYKNLKINDVILFEPDVHKDNRGYFYESYNQKVFDEAIGFKVQFAQDNHSNSVLNSLRGLHFQKKPFEQAKLVRVIKGNIYDVAVDIRKNSSTFGQYIAEELSAKNKKQLWIPKGFAHGFLVLSSSAEVIYKTDSFYNKESEETILWDDKTLNISWPLTDNPIVSSKDQHGVTFKGYCDH